MELTRRSFIAGVSASLALLHIGKPAPRYQGKNILDLRGDDEADHVIRRPGVYHFPPGEYRPKRRSLVRIDNPGGNVDIHFNGSILRYGERQTIVDGAGSNAICIYNCCFCPELDSSNCFFYTHVGRDYTIGPSGSDASAPAYHPGNGFPIHSGPP